MIYFHLAVAALLAFAPSPAAAVQTKAPAPAAVVPVKTETVVKGIDSGWSLEFLPDGRMLVTEKDGRMKIFASDGSWVGVTGLPKVRSAGQGGLLDVALAPDFAKSGLVFFSFAEDRGGRNGTTLATGRLVESARTAELKDVRILFRQKPDIGSNAHFGSRIVFAPDGTLFLTVGDQFVARDEAQNPANHVGKVIRLNQDGSPAAANPRLPGWAPEVWSIGHRNVQGAALHPRTGQLWTVEHGARGGDEINRPEAGKNYGWPVISYGRDYSGAKIGVGTSRDGLEQPVYYWDPSIAPAGVTFYSGDLVPEWQGSLFVTALAGSHVARVVFDGETVVGEERLLTGLGERFRDVKQGPDGAVYVLTDGDSGRIFRLSPAR